MKVSFLECLREVLAVMRDFLIVIALVLLIAIVAYNWGYLTGVADGVL